MVDSRVYPDIYSQEPLDGRCWTHPRKRDMSKRHLRPVKVEKVHQLDHFALAQRGKVDPFRLVVELELDREDLDMFCYQPPTLSPLFVLTQEWFRGGLFHRRGRSRARRCEAKESLEKVQCVLIDVET